MAASSPPSRRLAVAAGLAVVAAALLPWIIGRGPTPEPKEAQAPAAPDPAPAGPKKKEAPVEQGPERRPPAEAAPPEVAVPSDAPQIDVVHRALASFGSEYPHVDSLLSAVADVLVERPPEKSAEAGMNKVELTLVDPERTVKAYALSVGGRDAESYDVSIDVAHGPLAAEVRDRFGRLLNCRFYIDVKGDGTAPAVRGAVRFEPIVDETRIGGPYLCGYSIGSFEDSQRFVPFMAEVVRETDGTIGYRTRADDALAVEFPLADASRLVEVLRAAFHP